MADHLKTPRQRPLPRLTRRRSGISGWGVYTRGAIRKNTHIIEYTGERISMAESLKRERRHLKAGRIWCFAVSRRVVVDASDGGNLARFINHACRPNCYSRIIKGRIWICAARNIRRGEELTYHYYSNGAAGLKCRCRPGCRTLL